MRTTDNMASGLELFKNAQKFAIFLGPTEALNVFHGVCGEKNLMCEHKCYIFKIQLHWGSSLRSVALNSTRTEQPRHWRLCFVSPEAGGQGGGGAGGRSWRALFGCR